MVQPGVSHVGTQRSQQYHSGGRARVGTVIGWWQPQQRTTFMQLLEQRFESFRRPGGDTGA